jgi:hypothetical protein
MKATGAPCKTMPAPSIEFHFHNYTGFILDDASCKKAMQTLEGLRCIGATDTVLLLRGKQPPDYRWKNINTTIDNNGKLTLL